MSCNKKWMMIALQQHYLLQLLEQLMIVYLPQENRGESYGCLESEDSFEEGYWLNGVLHGWGYRVLHLEGQMYEGNWSYGSYHGKGIFNNNDYRYQGDFSYGEFQGHGIKYGKSGFIYQGTWKSNRLNGIAKISRPDDGYSQGTFKDHKEEGFCIVKIRCLKSKDIQFNHFEGNFVGGLANGFGIYTYANGFVYKGEYKNGKRHGKGLIIDEHGNTAEGEFQNGKRHGKFMNKFKYIDQTYRDTCRYGKFQKGKFFRMLQYKPHQIENKEDNEQIIVNVHI